MSDYDSLTLTTSFPECPDDPSGHFVLSEVRERARAGGKHVVLAPGPRGIEFLEVERHLRAETVQPIEVERLGGKDAFGWPGALTRLRADPLRVLSAVDMLHQMRSRLRVIAARELVAHWLLPCGVLALEDGRPSTLWAHGSDVRLLTRSRVATRGFAERLRRGGAHVVFVADHLRDAVCEVLPQNLATALRARSSVRPAPIELELGSSSLPDLPDGDFIVWAGRFVRAKDPTMAARLAERHHLTLVMLGSGPIPVACSRFVTRLGQLPRRDALAVIARGCALVLTSTEEGQSTVAREARGLGKPVFGLRTRGIEESPDTRLFDSEEELGKALETFVRRTA